MDTQMVINILFASIGGMGGFITKVMWDAIRSLQKDLTDMQSSISGNYVRRDEFRDHAKRIEDALARIETKIDHKADKP